MHARTPKIWAELVWCWNYWSRCSSNLFREIIRVFIWWNVLLEIVFSQQFLDMIALVCKLGASKVLKRTGSLFSKCQKLTLKISNRYLKDWLFYRRSVKWRKMLVCERQIELSVVPHSRLRNLRNLSYFFFLLLIKIEWRRCVPNMTFNKFTEWCYLIDI